MSSKPIRGRVRLGIEVLERRELPAAQPLPVLMVIADQRDFYYREYGDTRVSLEAAGLDVVVSAATTNPSTPHAGSGQGPDGGIVTPDLRLDQADAADYSAIVFVGGWGSSMYQYAFPGDYFDNHYDGNATTKAVVNELINDFVAQDKFVTAICHGTTVLAWARVDGVSPINGKTMSVPWIGSPGVFYNGQSYGYFQLMQYEQAVANGATANTVSGQYGDPTTVADDVVVDGRIITAENYDSAAHFGAVIAEHLWADVEPENQSPIVQSATFTIVENSPAGAIVGTAVASDPDAGQVLTFSIVSGNTGNAFAIDSATGQIRVNNAGMMDFETTTEFNLVVQATDNGEPAMSASAPITIRLLDVAEPPPPPVILIGANVVIQGTPAADNIAIWTNPAGAILVKFNGRTFGPMVLGPGGEVRAFGGAGNDTIDASRSAAPVALLGDAGDDRLIGGKGQDFLDGGDGRDRTIGNAGNDVLLGGAGDDELLGGIGRDVLIGGLGSDRVDGGAGDDLLIGGTTSYDANRAALFGILAEWNSNVDLATRVARLQDPVSDVRLAFEDSIQDDGMADQLVGGAGADWIFVDNLDTSRSDRTDRLARRN